MTQVTEITEWDTLTEHWLDMRKMMDDAQQSLDKQLRLHLVGLGKAPNVSSFYSLIELKVCQDASRKVLDDYILARSLGLRLVSNNYEATGIVYRVLPPALKRLSFTAMQAMPRVVSSWPWKTVRNWRPN